MTFSFEKIDAVHNAVIAQLLHDRRPIRNLDATMGKNLKYDRKPLSIFLNSVEDTLYHHKPSYDFEVDGSFIKDALGLTVGELIQAIDRNTK